MTVYNVGALKGVYNQTGHHFLSLLPLITVTLDLGQYSLTPLYESRSQNLHCATFDTWLC